MDDHPWWIAAWAHPAIGWILRLRLPRVTGYAQLRGELRIGEPPTRKAAKKPRAVTPAPK